DADGDHADDVPVRRDVPAVEPAVVAALADHDQPADLHGRPDAPGGVRPPRRAPAGERGAQPGRDLVRLAAPRGAGGRHGRADRPGHARRRGGPVPQDRVTRPLARRGHGHRVRTWEHPGAPPATRAMRRTPRGRRSGSGVPARDAREGMGPPRWARPAAPAARPRPEGRGPLGLDCGLVVRDAVETNFAEVVGSLAPGAPGGPDRPVRPGTTLTGALCRELFAAQLGSRLLDIAARVLREKGQGFYTIGSSGHEGNAAVAAALRPTDPALLHYRSGAFYLARSAQAGRAPEEGLRDVLLGLCASAEEPIAGGRHKVFGHPGLAVIPQTSTIASHLPRAVG